MRHSKTVCGSWGPVSMLMYVLSSALICNAMAWRCSRRRGKRRPNAYPTSTGTNYTYWVTPCPLHRHSSSRVRHWSSSLYQSSATSQRRRRVSHSIKKTKTTHVELFRVPVVSLLSQALIEQGSPLKQFALPIVCDIANASKRVSHLNRNELHTLRYSLSPVYLISTETQQSLPLKQFALPTYCRLKGVETRIPLSHKKESHTLSDSLSLSCPCFHRDLAKLATEAVCSTYLLSSKRRRHAYPTFKQEGITHIEWLPVPYIPCCHRR